MAIVVVLLLRFPRWAISWGIHRCGRVFCHLGFRHNGTFRQRARCDGEDVTDKFLRTTQIEESFRWLHWCSLSLLPASGSSLDRRRPNLLPDRHRRSLCSSTTSTMLPYWTTSTCPVDLLKPSGRCLFEQFYLVYPVLLIAIGLLLRRLDWQRKVNGLLLCVVASSFIWSMVASSGPAVWPYLFAVHEGLGVGCRRSRRCQCCPLPIDSGLDCILHDLGWPWAHLRAFLHYSG